ncbi:MAG: DUF3575 domain-containing protein [Bacteroidia bacterium]
MFYIILLVLPVFCNGQYTVIKLNPLSLIVAKNTSIFLERKLTNSLSVQLGANYFSVKKTGILNLDIGKYDCIFDISGFGFTPEFRWYLLSSPHLVYAPKGIFIGSYLRYMNYNTITSYSNNYLDEKINLKSHLYSFGLTSGLQLIKNNIGMEVFIGPNLNYIDRKIISSSTSVNETQLDFSDSNSVLKLLGKRGIFPSVRAGLTFSGAF